ncbi:hypothetical protein HWV62_25804 [Athelia sp. TMB]|nr:hypothetical protein HWV62_25804 [Athelia sp. TMB]
MCLVSAVASPSHTTQDVVLGDGYAPCEYSTLPNDTQPTAAVFDADLPTTTTSAFRPENSYRPSAQRQLAFRRRAAWDAAQAAAVPSPTSTPPILPAVPPTIPSQHGSLTEHGDSAHSGSTRNSSECRDSRVGESSEDEDAGSEVEQGSGQAEEGETANPWMAKHGQKAKAWARLCKGVKTRGQCLKHPDSAVKKKMGEIIAFRQAPTDASSDGIRRILGWEGEIKIAAPLDRCIGFIKMAQEMSENKAAATRKACTLT